MRVEQSGFEEFDREMAKAEKGSKHTLEVSNGEEYAEILHKRDGFFVLNIDHLEANVEEAMDEVVAAFPGVLTPDIIDQGLTYAGHREINYLTETTEKQASPYRGKARRAHHGNWGDRKSHLVRAFKFRVLREGAE